MLKQEITVGNFLNHYDNPYAELIHIACKYDSSIHLAYETKRINAKSIMGIMSFQIPESSNVVLEADGPDESEAIHAISDYLNCKVGVA